jgi:hypothetical protein
MPDKIEEVVDVIRMPEVELWSLINPTNNGFTLKDPDELCEHNTISQRLFHIYDSEPELFPKATLDPLLCFANVTKILISLYQVTLSICPESSYKSSCRKRRRRGTGNCVAG